MYRSTVYIKEKKKTSSKTFEIIKNLTSVLVLLFVFNFIVNIYVFKAAAKDSLLLSPLAKEIVKKAEVFITSQQNSKGLEPVVLNVLGSDSKNFGVVVYNLKTGERYYLNDDKTFETASLYKLWVMVVSYKLIDENRLNETQVLAADASSLNQKFNISTESAEVSEGLVSWPVANALFQMITNSDNYSAYLLTAQVGIQNISNFLLQNGFLDSKVGTSTNNPVTTAKEMGLFFQRLYSGQLADSKTTNEMINLLKNQKINNKLPKYLDQNIEIAHKTGELNKFSHDAGIVYSKKGDYVIVVLSNTANPLLANEKISKISKEVFDYFEKVD